MTDNQNPLQVLENILTSSEKQAASTPETPEPIAEGPTAQKQVTDAEATASQAKIKQLEEQQATQDQELIAELRAELPQTIPKNAVVDEKLSDGNNLDNSDSSTPDQELTKKPHPVEQLQRLD